MRELFLNPNKNKLFVSRQNEVTGSGGRKEGFRGCWAGLQGRIGEAGSGALTEFVSTGRARE